MVLVDGDDRVFAKIIGIDDKVATIEYFHSVVERNTDEVNIDNLTRIELPRETRVFVEVSHGYWQIGRVLSHLNESAGATRYEVRFPNQNNQDLSETDLYVRCLDVYADPAETLAAGCAETQAVADKRRGALADIRNLRSACEGLTGAYSAAIELMPHQISTVRKVLQDTLVRYLLADEVGLGKTIEAGCIIRQMLLDRPNLRVLILVPDKLISQWCRELRVRFYIDTDAGNVSVLGYSASTSINYKPDLLVVDEAHRVIATSSEKKNSVEDHIGALAHEAESLLLLSATPALGDEVRLFGLLHLLDPSAYPTGDLEGFRKKIQSRQKIGHLLMTMQPGGTAFVVKSQAKSAIAMFQDDPYVKLIAQQLLDAGDNIEERDHATLMLRDHIARTYRIHDRLLRSRRTDAEGWAMRPRAEQWPNLSHVRIATDFTSWSADFSAALESWRVAAASVAKDHDLEIFHRWRDLVSISFFSRNALARHLEAMAPVFDGETDYLLALKAVAESDFGHETRMAALVEELKTWRAEQKNNSSRKPAKIACFLSDEEDATDIYDVLSQHFGSFDVLNLSDSTDELERESKIAAFQDDPQCWVLIGSRDAEEGLNLQFVNAIIHLDLPADVSRLEQRIGRLDRFGRKLPKLEHRLFLPDNDEDAPWYVWMEILMNGFRIFNGSVSDIQFKHRELENIIWSRFMLEGGGCVEALSEQVHEYILAERKKLNEQHVLDQIANINDDAVPFIERMEEAEEDEDRLNKSVLNWLSGVLQISQEPQYPAGDEPHRLFWYRPLLPLVPWGRILQNSLDCPSTWRRLLAQNTKKNPILLRPGSPLLNTLERISNWDDRGTTYATWRVDPSIKETWVGFRWVWVLSPGVETDAAVWRDLKRPDLHRRAESYLPIMTIDRWTDANGELIEDVDLLKKLNRPYVKKPNISGIFDINLGSRPDDLAQIFDPIVFRNIVKELRDKTSNAVWTSDEISNALAKSLGKFDRDDALIRRSLERRQVYLEKEFRQKFKGVENALKDLDLLRRAIEKPKLRLDECGLMVLSPEAPNAGGE
ncbi:protein DpdE [Rhodospirillales bacterium]|nr:protein DpdE [Rhodospirillales bacterium]